MARILLSKHEAENLQKQNSRSNQESHNIANFVDGHFVEKVKELRSDDERPLTTTRSHTNNQVARYPTPYSPLFNSRLRPSNFSSNTDPNDSLRASPPLCRLLSLFRLRFLLF